MPELEVLEAKAPVRTPRLIEVESEPKSGRFAPVAGWLSGPVFSRARDIFAANMTELLDRAEDPARMIRMIILEMEETLVEVRATAARSIADMKEMRRAVSRLDELKADWTAKAELALSKDREDLAKAALAERQKAAEMAEGLRDEIDGLEQVLRGYEADIAKLQAKLREARARQHAIAARFESALTQGQGAGDDARQPDARCVRQVRACSSAAPTSPRVAAMRWGSPASKTRSTNFAPTRRSTPNWKP